MINPEKIAYKTLRLPMHVLFWFVLILAGSFILSYNQNYPFRFYLYSFLINLPVHLIYTYLFVYFIVSRKLLEGRIVSFIFFFVFASLGMSILRQIVNKFLFYDNFIPSYLHPVEWFNIELTVLSFIWLITPTILFVAIKFYKDWVQSQKEKSEIEKRQLESELQLLKAQLNPHFLFNTLNNLYVLALKKSDKAPVIISQMSDLFHYILYECNAVKVPVAKEIKLIENYIDLELIRYSDRLKLTFNKNIENLSFQLPPMLLFTFAENCFKHGASKDPSSPWIHFNIEQRSNVLKFSASNSRQPVEMIDSTKSGVGLKNIRKRLGLLYPGNYNLDIVETKDRFSVFLTIRNEE